MKLTRTKFCVAFAWSPTPVSARKAWPPPAAAPAEPAADAAPTTEEERGLTLKDLNAASPPPVDPFAAIKRRAQDALFARLGSRLYDSSMDESQLDAYVVQELSKVIDQEQVPLTPAERARIVASLVDDVLGYGAIEKHLADKSWPRPIGPVTLPTFTPRQAPVPCRQPTPR
mgnify:CR=1 FL=1